VLLVAGIGALFTAVGALKLIRKLRERHLPADGKHSPADRGRTPSTEAAADHPRREDEGLMDSAE
jgi:hypothetical protein